MSKHFWYRSGFFPGVQCWSDLPTSTYPYLWLRERKLCRKGKAIPLQACTEPEGSQISRQSAHEVGKVVSPTQRQSLPPRKYSWYSFLLGAVSTPGKCYINERSQWHNQESKLRPSGLYSSASTNCGTACPLCRYIFHKYIFVYTFLYRHFIFTDRNIIAISRLFLAYHMPVSNHLHQLGHNITINPLNTKRRLLYLKTQFIPRCCAMY